MAEFFVESGPDLGESYILTDNHATIGKGEDSNFQLAGDPTLADLHAIVRQRGPDLLIAPIHSSYPVLVNGRLARKPTQLGHGDRITLGQDIIGCYFSASHLHADSGGWSILRSRFLSTLGIIVLALISLVSVMMLFRMAPMPARTPVWLPLIAAVEEQADEPVASQTKTPHPTATVTVVPTIVPAALEPTNISPSPTRAAQPIAPPTSRPTPTPVPPTPTPAPALTDSEEGQSPSSGKVTIFGVGCQISPDWQTYEVQSGDTLWKIAQEFNTTAIALIRGNCLEDEMIYTGTTLWVPLKK